MSLIELAASYAFAEATWYWAFVTLVLVFAGVMAAGMTLGSYRYTFRGSTVLGIAGIILATLAILFQLTLWGLAIWAPLFV